MINYISLNFIFLLIITLAPSFSFREYKSNNNTENKNLQSQTLYILEWAKTNNIYINENLILNKNTDKSHNFYYFSSNSTLPNNTILMKVPYNIMISKETLLENFIRNKNKKFIKLWKKISSMNNEFLINYATKQLLYMSIIIENSINKKKGFLYKKYEAYFNMYEYINMDNFPVFFDEDEIYFLSASNFGAELVKASESLKEEYLITKNELKIETSMPDTFLKYRVLSLANSIRFNNTNIKTGINNSEYNDTVIVPFIDCFKKKINNKNSTMADYSILKDENNQYYLEIKTIKDIKEREEITLQWRRLSNQDSYLYYGFIDKENFLLPSIYINIFNNLMKKDLGFDVNNNFSDVAKRDLYELNSEFLESEIINSYKNISNLIDKYKNKKEGRYEMMEDNFNYYLRIYDEQYTDGNINLNIRGEEKRRIIKLLMKFEKDIFNEKINFIRLLIQDIKEKKFNIDDL